MDRPRISHTIKVNNCERTVTVTGYPADEAEALVRRLIDAPSGDTETSAENRRIEPEEMDRGLREWAERVRKLTGMNPFRI